MKKQVTTYISGMADTNVDAFLSPVLNLQELLGNVLQLGCEFTTWDGSRHQCVLHRLAGGTGSIRHLGPDIAAIKFRVSRWTRQDYSQCNRAFGKGNFGGISDLL